MATLTKPKRTEETYWTGRLCKSDFLGMTSLSLRLTVGLVHTQKSSSTVTHIKWHFQFNMLYSAGLAASISWYGWFLLLYGVRTLWCKYPKTKGREDLAGAPTTQEILTLFIRKGFLEYCRSQTKSVEAHGRCTDYWVPYMDLEMDTFFRWSVMVVFSVQLAEGGGPCLPLVTLLYLPLPLELQPPPFQQG